MTHMAHVSYYTSQDVARDPDGSNFRVLSTWSVYRELLHTPDGEPIDGTQRHVSTHESEAAAEADRLWFSGQHGSPVDWRGGYVRGRADERAQAEGAGSSLSTQEGYEWLVDHDKQVRAHERARIAARRAKVAAAVAEIQSCGHCNGECGSCQEEVRHILAALGVTHD